MTILAVVCFMFLANSAMTAIQDGLIVYFPLDDAGGTTVADASGNGFDGTIMDEDKVEWVEGQNGFEGALNFSGQGFGEKAKGERTGRIEVTKDLGSHDELSFSLWFFTTRDNDWNYLMDFRPTGSWFARDEGNQIILNGQGGVPSGDYPREEWVHLVVLADSSSTRYYINGEETGNAGGAANLNISTSLHIGSRFSKNESFLSIMDDIAIWERLLSDAEIALANQGPVLGPAAVGADGKLPVRWARIKQSQ